MPGLFDSVTTQGGNSRWNMPQLQDQTGWGQQSGGQSGMGMFGGYGGMGMGRPGGGAASDMMFGAYGGGGGGAGAYGELDGGLGQGANSQNRNQRITQQNTFVPWGPQGAALKQLFNRGMRTLDQNMAAGPIDPSAQTLNALNWMSRIASGGNPGMASALNANRRASMGGFDMDQSGYQDIYGQTQQPGFLDQGMFGQMAEGGLMNSNPYRSAALDDMLGSVNDSVRARMSSMGRYGSDAMGEALGRSLGGVSSQFMNQAYNDDQNRFMQAALGRDASQQGRMGLGLSALQGQQSALGQNAAIQQAAAGLAPTLSDARYNDARALAGVGAARDQIAQDRRNYNWQQLGNAQGIFGNLPGAAGTQTQRQPGGSSWLNLLGGGMAGLGALGSLAGLFGMGM